MSTALGLAMQISANTAQLATAVAEVNKRLDEMGSAGKKAADDLGALKNIEIAKLALGGIKAAGSAFLSLSTSVVGAMQSVVDFGKTVADELDSLNDVANRTGVGVEALQAYGAAAKLSGTDIETFAKSLQKLSVNIGNATDEKTAKKFTDLGVSFEALKAASPTEQFEMVADAIAKIQDPAERAAAAVKVFGKGGIELGPLFSEGPGALAKMREEAVALGLVVSEDSVKSIAAMNDAFDKVWMTVKGLTGQIVGELAGPIANIAEELLNVVKQVGAGNIANTIAGGLIDFIQMAGDAFFSLARFIEGFVKKYGTLLGIDVTTQDQKKRSALEQEQSQLQAIIDAGGKTVVQRLALGVRAVREGDKERLQQVAEELKKLGPASAGTLESLQASFNRSLDVASTKIAEQTKPPVMPETASAQSVAVSEANGQGKEQLGVLKDIRDEVGIGTVEIIGN